MVEGRLAPELMSLIPANAVRWPTVLENDLRKHRAVPDSIVSQSDAHGGVIFHYDTFFIHRIGSQDYSKDPISPYLFETTNLTIVNIKPTPRQLKAQYDQRLHSQFTKMGYVRGLWRQSGRKWLKKMRYRFFGVGLPYTRDLYNQTASIEACHRSWEKFLGNLIGARQVTQLVEIIPEGGPDSDWFKLLNSHEVSNGNRATRGGGR